MKIDFRTHVYVKLDYGRRKMLVSFASIIHDELVCSYFQLRHEHVCRVTIFLIDQVGHADQQP